MTDNPERQPLAYTITKWYAFILTAMYLLYGGVKLILAMLDRNYTDVNNPTLSFVVGIVLAIISYGFNIRKSWGWYGLVTVNGLIVLLAIFKLTQIDNVILLFLSLIVLACLFAAQTRKSIFGNR
jgi:hypothetical protein